MNTYFCYNEKYVSDNGRKLCLSCRSEINQREVTVDAATLDVTLHLQHRLINKQEMDRNLSSYVNRCSECGRKIIIIVNVSDCDECSKFMSIVENNSVSSSSSSFFY
jgi:hypothetical protein